MSNNLQYYLILGGIILLVVLLIVSLVKKAIKLVIFALVILIIYSGYSILVKNVSPLELMLSYKTNIEYGKDITNYSLKTKDSVDKIKSAANPNGFNQEAINSIKNEDKNLKQYLSDVQALKHTESLNGLHDAYVNNLKNIVFIADNISKLADNKDVNKLGDTIKQLNDSMDKLNELKKQM